MTVDNNTVKEKNWSAVLAKGNNEKKGSVTVATREASLDLLEFSLLIP